MLARTKLAFLAALSLTAAACGLKGPLYRPDEARNESVTPANPAQQPNESPKKKDTSSNTTPGEESEPGVSPPDPDRAAVPPDR